MKASPDPLGEGLVGCSPVSGPDTEVERFVCDIIRIHGKLSQRTDLSPCKVVNELFGELVGLCTQTLSTHATEKILENEWIQELTPSLRRLCATAECHLEAHWASHIPDTDSAEIGAYQRLREFPYYENYVDLARMELSAIYAVRPSKPRNIAFIGSGPLPLSSLCLCQALDQEVRSRSHRSYNSISCRTTVLNIDNNPQAIFQSRALAESLGSRAQGMEFLCQEAGSSDLDIRAFDVVYLAALVGITQEAKERVVIDVVSGMRVGSLLVIRTAHGLRSLLYPDFDASTEAILACLEICMVIHPYNHVVNSVIVGKVKPRGSRAKL